MTYRILVTARSFGSTSDLPGKMLADAGCVVIPGDRTSPWNEERLITALQSVDGLIAGNDPITARVLDACPRLRVIAKHGTGVDNIDLEAAGRRGIIVANTPRANAGAVAELAIGFMFALARRLLVANQQARAHNWKPVAGMELAGRTLGVVGLGHIGKTLVERMSGLNMTVLAYDPIQDSDFAHRWRVRYASLEELLCESDFVSLHAPLTPATRALIDAAALARMKPTAYLVNTARAELVDEQALCTALREKRIAGAAIDALADNPAHPLFTLDNVIITPHVGAHTAGAITAMSMGAATNLVAALQGDLVPDRVI